MLLAHIGALSLPNDKRRLRDRQTDRQTETETERQRQRDREKREGEEKRKVSNLVFYAQSTITVISSRKSERVEQTLKQS